MTIIVGFGPNTSESVLRLAERIDQDGADIVLCGVVLNTWEGPSLATGLDPEWHRGLVEQMEQTLTDARNTFSNPDAIETIVRTGPSVPAELTAESQKRRAELLVVGSSRRAAFGRVSLGSISDQLVHGAELPIALTPNEYRPVNTDTIERLVLGMDPNDVSYVADEAAEFAAGLGIPVELVTFGVSPWPQGGRADNVGWEGMFKDWGSQVRSAHETAESKLNSAGVTVSGHQRVFAHRWANALNDFEWQHGDMLALLSSRRGPVSRVFLGSTAARMLRHTPVPTVVLPRSHR